MFSQYGELREFGAPQQISTGFAPWQCYCTAVKYWVSAKLCGVEQRALPIFGRAAITLGCGSLWPHFSNIIHYCDIQCTCCRSIHSTMHTHRAVKCKVWYWCQIVNTESNAPSFNSPVADEERMRPGHWLGSMLLCVKLLVG